MTESRKPELDVQPDPSQDRRRDHNGVIVKGIALVLIVLSKVDGPELILAKYKETVLRRFQREPHRSAAGRG